jgi:hypothetical protein
MLIFFLMKYRFFFNLWQHWSTNFILFNINQQQQNSREFEKSLAWILEIDRTKTFLSVDIRFFVARKSSLLVCTHTGWKSRGESSSSFWQNPGGGGLWGASRLISPPTPTRVHLCNHCFINLLRSFITSVCFLLLLLIKVKVERNIVSNPSGGQRQFACNCKKTELFTTSFLITSLLLYVGIPAMMWSNNSFLVTVSSRFNNATEVKNRFLFKTRS